MATKNVVSDIIIEGAINSIGKSDFYLVTGKKRLELLVKIGSKTGSPSITFHVRIIDPISGSVIKTYDGNTLTDEATDVIVVDSDALGSHAQIEWDGTLDSSNYFDNCRVWLVLK